MKWAKGLRLVVIVSTVLMVLAGASVIYGGLRWSGFDPIVLVDGTEYSLTVAVAPGHVCRLSEDVQVTFHVPEGARNKLVSEQDVCNVSTSTSFEEDADDDVYASVLVPARHRLPVDAVLVSGDPDPQFCSGWSNEEFDCGDHDGKDKKEKKDK